MNQISDAFLMPDVQASIDRRRIPIGRVGVRGVRYPLQWRSPGRDAQATVGQWDLDVHLPETQKGTHMSRFVELLDALDGPLDEAGFRTLLSRMLDRLDASAGRIDVSFPYFARKRAPVSGVESLLDYAARVTGKIERGTDMGATNTADAVQLWLEVSVPVTSLCPCSKEISRYGAHNQRSHVTIRARTEGALAFDDLIRVAEEEASCELWGLLKRPDEKFVTERAYENPKFVEDLVRDVAVRLDAEPRVRAYRIDAENFESIHNHSAYASIERAKRDA